MLSKTGISIAANAVISARGGNGSGGNLPTAQGQGGGGGGGGGIIHLIAPVAPTTTGANLLVSGGNSGDTAGLMGPSMGVGGSGACGGYGGAGGGSNPILGLALPEAGGVGLALTTVTPNPEKLAM